ncbi:hypothetical protein BKA70DRAFT_1266411 [Coprinopsis sp. MPI-PUGE-AT-0042]|nr:hypothetical protein BKA70DRAFT_1266411 [Coprinopsis sp. MPI-PUGE-AT-0042]
MAGVLNMNSPADWSCPSLTTSSGSSTAAKRPSPIARASPFSSSEWEDDSASSLIPESLTSSTPWSIDVHLDTPETSPEPSPAEEKVPAVFGPWNAAPSEEQLATRPPLIRLPPFPATHLSSAATVPESSSSTEILSGETSSSVTESASEATDLVHTPLAQVAVDINPTNNSPATKKTGLRHKVKAIFTSPSKPKSHFEPPVENVAKQTKMKDLTPHPDYLTYGWVQGEDPTRPKPEYPLISQYYGRLAVPMQPKSAALLEPEPKLTEFYERKLSRPYQVPVRRLDARYGVAKAIGWIKTLKEDIPVGCSADGSYGTTGGGQSVSRGGRVSMSMIALDMHINKRIANVAGEDKRVGESGMWYLLAPPMHRNLADFFRLVKEEGRAGHILDEVAMTWAKQLVVAVDFLHSLGVIHRDLTDFNQAYMSPTTRALKPEGGLQCQELYESDRVSYEVGIDESHRRVVRYGVEADWWSVGAFLQRSSREGPLWGVSRTRFLQLSKALTKAGRQQGSKSVSSVYVSCSVKSWRCSDKQISCLSPTQPIGGACTTCSGVGSLLLTLRRSIQTLTTGACNGGDGGSLTRAEESVKTKLTDAFCQPASSRWLNPSSLRVTCRPPAMRSRISSPLLPEGKSMAKALGRSRIGRGSIRTGRWDTLYPVVEDCWELSLVALVVDGVIPEFHQQSACQGHHQTLT